MWGVTTVLLLITQLSAAYDTSQYETPVLTQSKQRTDFQLTGPESAFKFSFSDTDVAAVTDNEAVLQQRATKASNPFLSTLTAPGQAQFLTLLKPCGILMPHVHLRANEFYTVLYGTMDAGIAPENGGPQNITFRVGPGEAFVVPQGTLHYNHNRECEPNAFVQSFTSADPGAINIVGALAALRDSGEAGEAAINASSASYIEASPFGSFAVDKQCLKKCGFPETGAYGGNLTGIEGLPEAIKDIFGVEA